MSRILFVIQLLLIILKGAGYLPALSWGLVFLPMYMLGGIVVIGLIIMCVIMFVCDRSDKGI